MRPRQRGEHSSERRRFPRMEPALRPRAGERVIAIIGAGASGTLAAVHLLRLSRASVVLIDPRRPGPGVAYSTGNSRHLLNAPASAMSALTGEPDDFLLWCRSRGVAAEPGAFLARGLYGIYLRQLLARFAGRRLHVVRAQVQSIAEPLHGGIAIALSDSSQVHADAAILALGSAPPAPLPGVPPVPPHALLSDPWAPGALVAAARDARSVTILGTGLTAVDCALSIADASPLATITAISRSGVLPRAHLPEGNEARALDLAAGSSLQEILDAVGLAVSERPPALREVIDGLRPCTQELWQGLCTEERRRFHSELRSCWEVHRHRLAPPVAQRIGELRAGGRLTVRAGAVAGVSAGRGSLARVALADGSLLESELVINATGPGPLRSWANPLLTRLLRSGRLSEDELGIGLATSAEGALLDHAGVPSTRLFTLGPARRGELLESTAVPEIRRQADALAQLLCREGDSCARSGRAHMLEQA